MNKCIAEIFSIDEVTEKSELDALYQGSALTFEGTIVSDENMAFLASWLKEKGADPVENIAIKCIKGATMNEAYGLTGTNAYPNDLHIVCIPLSQLGNVNAIVIERFALGGRWFDDVVDNNKRREEEK